MNTQTTVKRQKRKLQGSVFNYLMGNNISVPEIGKGATILHWTDRTCAEVVEISKDGKTIKLESLEAEWDETLPGGMGHQNWILKPTGRFFHVYWRHNAWRTKSEQVMFTEEYASTLGPKFHGSADYEKCFVNGEMIVVEGITELKISYNKINILFGQKNYHYDWSF